MLKVENLENLVTILKNWLNDPTFDRAWKKETFDNFFAQAINDNVYVLTKVGCCDNEMSLKENWKKKQLPFATIF